MKSIYKDILLDHYKNPRNYGALTEYDTSVTVENPLCGDTISLQCKVNEDKVTSVGYETEGCVISTAAASILSEYVTGKTLEEVKQIDREKMLDILGVKLGAVRAKCALLPLEAVSKAIQQL